MSVQGINIPLDVGATIVPLYGKTGNNTAAEDSPSAPSPAVIYDMKNVMPSELGYSSAFALTGLDLHGEIYLGRDDYTKYESYHNTSSSKAVARIKTARTQKVIPYTTGNGTLVYLILTEDGVYCMNPMAEQQEDPWSGENNWDGDYTGLGKYTLLFPIVSDEPELLHLWTAATIDGKLFLYLQGQPEVFIVGPTTLKDDLENWKSRVTVKFNNEDFMLQVLSAAPTFLNMEGQVGIFQAGNRLGFWDSDNATAWSSAFDKLDFEPDVVALSGITTFADLQGEIVMVLPTLEGFVIYATSSIIDIRPIRESTEKWGATTVLRGTGIDYYFQATTGSNPDIHFAWTKDGLYMISQGQATPFRTEEYRELKQAPSADRQGTCLYALTAIGQEYLIVSKADAWSDRGAVYSVRAGKLETDNGDYNFYLPVIKPSYPGKEWLGVILGNDGYAPEINGEDFYAEPDLDIPLEHADKQLVPCYSGYAYRGPRESVMSQLQGTLDNGSAVPLPPMKSYHYPNIEWERLEQVGLAFGGNLFACDWQPNEGATHLGVASLTPPFIEGLDWVARPPIGYDNEEFLDVPATEFLELVNQAFVRFNEDVAKIWGPESGLADAQPKLFDPRPKCAGSYNGNAEDPGISTTGWLFKGFSLDDWSEEPFEPIEVPTNQNEYFTTALVIANQIAQLTAQKLELETIAARSIGKRKKEILEQIQTIQNTIDSLKSQISELEDKAEDLFTWIYNDGPLPFPNMHRVRLPNAISHAPVPGITPVVVQDDCGITVYAYMDDMEGVGVWLPQVIPYETAWREVGFDVFSDRYPDLSCGIPANATCNEDGKLGWLNSQNECVLNGKADCIGEFVPNGVISVYVGDAQGNRSASGTREWRQQFKQSIDSTFYYYPMSFKNKTFDQIVEMLNPNNVLTNPNWVPIFQAEVSGYGYLESASSSWERFVKTISKARLWMMDPEGGCTPKMEPKIWQSPPYEEIIEEDYYDVTYLDEWDGSFPGEWDGRPVTIPDGPTYPEEENGHLGGDIFYSALFRKGTRAPYYPIYNKAWVLDIALNKWGSLDTPHSVIFPVHPPESGTSEIVPDAYTNPQYGEREWAYPGLRTGVMPFGIVPKFAVPWRDDDANLWFSYRWNRYGDFDVRSLMQHQLPTFLAPESESGKIVIGEISLTRQGMTKLTGVYGSAVAFASLEVAGNHFGGNFGKNYLPRSGQGSASSMGWYPNALQFNFLPDPDERELKDFVAPLVLVGKEFQITLEGHFRLHKLICYAQPTGRLFYPEQSTEKPW